MAQLHKRFSDEQVRAIFRNYNDGQMRREEAQELLEISKSQFFVLLKEFRANPSTMTIEYNRKSVGRIQPAKENNQFQRIYCAYLD